MRVLKVSAFIIFLMGTAAAFGNFLWLIGILPKPESTLMDARWVYAFVSYTFGVSMLIVSKEL